MRGITGLAENRLASPEGMCSMEQVSRICRWQCGAVNADSSVVVAETKGEVWVG